MLAARLTAYTGVMQARAIALDRDGEGGGSAAAPGGSGGKTVVSDTSMLDMLANEGFAEKG